MADLAYTTIRKTTDHGLHVIGYSYTTLAKQLAVRGLIVSDTGGVGLRMDSLAAFADGSTGLSISTSGRNTALKRNAVRFEDAQQLPGFPTNSTFQRNGVNSVEVGEAWLTESLSLPAISIPYDFATGIQLRNSAELKVNAGSHLRLPREGISLYGTPVKLTAVGTTSAPIRFTGIGSKPWGALSVQSPASASLENVVMEDGGAVSVTTPGPTIRVVGSGAGPIEKLIRVKNVKLLRSHGVGVGLEWMGIMFRRQPPDPTQNRINHARVEYAGRDIALQVNQTCNEPSAGAIMFDGWQPPPFITNTILAHSATNGITRSHLGDRAPDFTKYGNTFIGIPACAQTEPMRADGSCAIRTCPSN